ncbi:MAG: 16S rRNA (cytosine(967)-C(5))-methyltransferase RsmB [Clostridia bacterium]|nr:16S rRNA (cytosine(967)-C(5))-methyltransferase RsmB [Clostridia bacterium]
MDKKPEQQGKAQGFGRKFDKDSRPAGAVSGKRGDRPARSFDKKDGKPYGKPAGKPGFGKPAGKSFGKPGEGKRPFGDRKPIGRPMEKPVEKKPDPSLPSTNSRKVALEIFQDVIRKDAYAALSLDDRLSRANLTQLDKRFCASIVYRTLENLIRIDYALSFFLKDPEGLDPAVRDILRISACQLLFHDRIPDNAVVDEAVKLTRSLGMEGLTGLTNAVLRGMVRGKDEIKWPMPEEGARYLSIMFSVPQWLAEKLMDAYGPEMAREICAYRTQNHFTTIRPNVMKYTDEQFEELLRKKVWEVEKGAVPHAVRVRLASEIARDADYLSGNFSIQGESSMLAAQAMDVKRGMQVLDCCAAPGGKTAYLAEQMQGTGRVYAWDMHEHRVTLIRAMMKRLNIENVRPVVRDASVLKEDLVSSMDAVLLDAPCSGLGVMDNKPDIKQRATAEGVAELAQVQEKLLDTCCQYVKRGGTFVYSTCSMLPDENSDQVKKFLEKHPEFEIAPLPASFDEKFKAQYTAYGLQLLPHRDGVEGFFIARMRRVK